MLKENKYFDLSFDDFKDVKFNFVDTKISEKMQLQQTEENLEQHIEEILNDFKSGNTIDVKFVMKVLFLTLFGVKSQTLSQCITIMRLFSSQNKTCIKYNALI